MKNSKYYVEGYSSIYALGPDLYFGYETIYDAEKMAKVLKDNGYINVKIRLKRENFYEFE